MPGQMSLWQLKSVLDVHRNLPLKFHQNRVSNRWDIADIEFVWVGVQSHFIVKPNLVLRLGWGFDKKERKMWLFATGRHRRGRWKNTPRARSHDIICMKPFSEESLCENWLSNPVLSQYYCMYRSSSLSGGLWLQLLCFFQNLINKVKHILSIFSEGYLAI